MRRFFDFTQLCAHRRPLHSKVGIQIAGFAQVYQNTVFFLFLPILCLKYTMKFIGVQQLFHELYKGSSKSYRHFENETCKKYLASLA